MPTQVQEDPRKPNRLDQNRTIPWHIIIETTSTQSRERILKVVREKKITYKGKPIKTSRFQPHWEPERTQTPKPSSNLLK
jgi:hypothetical protein